MTPRETYTEGIRIMSQITGMSQDDLLNTRKYPCPFARGILFERLHSEGVPYLQIEHICGYGHDTIMYICSRLDDIERGDTHGYDLVMDIRAAYYEAIRTQDNAQE